MRKVGRLLLALMLCTAFLSGCNEQKSWNPLKNNEEIKIAVLGSPEFFDPRKDFFEGMDVAIEELAEKGVKISYTIFDDENNYDKGVSLAKEIVSNDSYLIAMTFQEFDTVDTVASVFEEYRKPLIIADGCYDDTMNKGYDYVLNLTVSAEDSGKEMGSYVMQKKYKWVAIAHNGRYSLDLQNGLNRSLAGSGISYIVDLVDGPNKATEAGAVFDRWKSLGVQAVAISMDDTEWMMELVELIRKYCPEIAILGDRYFNDITYMQEYGSYLEGMVMPSSFPVDRPDELKKFYDKYKSKIDDAYLTSVTALGHDAISMINEKLSNVNTVNEFMENMKSTDGYNGIVGIKLKRNGELNAEPNYWIIKNNVVYRLENEAVSER